MATGACTLSEQKLRGLSSARPLFKRQFNSYYMHRQTAIEKLADLIEANPECSFDIDNDAWYMNDKNGKEITNSEHWEYSTEWYAHSNNYGAGIAEAMVVLLNRRGFNIQASAV